MINWTMKKLFLALDDELNDLTFDKLF